MTLLEVMALVAPPQAHEQFQQLYLDAAPRVQRLLLGMVAGDRDIASDLTAETFARAFRRWDAVSQADSQVAWVCRVAINLARRQRGASRLIPVGLTVKDRRAPERPQVDLELRAAIAKLPTRYRQAIYLRYFADLTEREIALTLGISEGGASSLLTKARASLRASLEPTDE